MELFAELPLAVFTTLAPAASGAFLLLAIALAVSGDEAFRRKLCRAGLVPLALVALSFVAAFFHLANPLNAPWVLLGVARSPMSNEIMGGVLFALVALAAVWIGGWGRVSSRAQLGLMAAAGILGVVFSLLVGLAYRVETVATWYQPSLPVIAVGEALAAGAVLGCGLIRWAFPPESLVKGPLAKAALALVVVGALGTLAGEAVWFAEVSTVVTPLADGAARAGDALALVAAGCGLFAIGSLAGVVFLVRKKSCVGAFVVAWAIMVVGVFLLRLAFYGMQISVGL